MMFDKRKLITITINSIFIVILSAAATIVAAEKSLSSHGEEQTLNYTEADTDSINREHGKHKGHHGIRKNKGEHSKCNMFRADTNKDGKISREEFMTRYEQKFIKKDLNKDGFIDKDEMHQMKKNKHRHDSEKTQCKTKQ